MPTLDMRFDPEVARRVAPYARSGLRAAPLAALLAIALLISIVGCSSSHLEPPDVLGPIALGADAGAPRLWVLTKQEEVRTVGVGSSRRSARTRVDSLFHFDLKAFDPLTARPVWTKRLMTIGDSEASGSSPSRVIGSSSGGRLLGQDGQVVWLLIDSQPFAVSAADGRPLADAAAIEQHNPALKGRLPREAKYYGFDQGLVLTSADARRLVIRSPEMKALPYVPKPPPVAAPDRMANGNYRIVPPPPIGEVLARQAQLGGQWLGLYSEKEAADVANDARGNRFRYPHTVFNEGAQVRRGFWHGRVVAVKQSGDDFEKVVDMAPVASGPTFLRGRFLKDRATGKPRLLDAPAGLMVWHRTRIDNAGRLALSLLGTDLGVRWTAELPLSENSTGNPVSTWPVGDRIVVAGRWEQVEDGVTRREPHLVTVQLSDGTWQAWNLERDSAVER